MAITHENRQEPDRGRQSAKAAVKKPQQHRRRIADRRAVTEYERNALKHAAGGKRGDNRRNSKARNQHAIEQTDARADAQRQRDGPRRRRIRAVCVGCYNDCRERDGPRDRKIEASGSNDRALPQAKNSKEAAERKE